MENQKYDSQYSILKDQIRVLGGDPDVSKPNSCYEAQLEILKLLEEGGGVTPDEVKEIVEEYNYTTMAAVEDKKYMQQKKLTLNGDATAIVDEEGNTLTYDEVKALVDNKALFVYLLVDNAFYIPCGDMVVPSGHNAVEFSSAFIVAGEASIARIIIDTENEVLYEQYWMADKDWVRSQGFLDKNYAGTNILKDGKIQIGDATTNGSNAYLHIRNVGDSSKTGSSVNGAGFAVGGDGYATFQHKTYNDAGGNAKNDSVLRFSDKGIQFAINSTSGASPSESDYKNVITAQELTQAQYDALTVKDPATLYIITDAD